MKYLENDAFPVILIQEKYAYFLIRNAVTSILSTSDTLYVFLCPS